MGEGRSAGGRRTAIAVGAIGIAVIVALVVTGLAHRDRVRALLGGRPPAAVDAPAIIRGPDAPEGWYVTVQALVDAEQRDQILGHLKALGYDRFWVRPRKTGKKDLGYEDILLGPLPGATSKAEADAEVKRFRSLMAANPLKRPRLDFMGTYSFRIGKR